MKCELSASTVATFFIAVIKYLYLTNNLKEEGLVLAHVFRGSIRSVVTWTHRHSRSVQQRKFLLSWQADRKQRGKVPLSKTHSSDLLSPARLLLMFPELSKVRSVCSAHELGEWGTSYSNYGSWLPGRSLSSF